MLCNRQGSAKAKAVALAVFSLHHGLARYRARTCGAGMIVFHQHGFSHSELAIDDGAHAALAEVARRSAYQGADGSPHLDGRHIGLPSRISEVGSFAKEPKFGEPPRKEWHFAGAF